jgi:DNA invertase Pin-like site-specific DNA recombinase
MTEPTVYAMYLRKSEMDVKWEQKNPDGEDPLARHERKLRRLAKQNGGVVGEVFADPDKSASKENVYREDFERMLLALPKFGGLLAMDVDRVARASKPFERVIDAFEAAPHLKFLVADKARSPDLGSPEGRNAARTLVIRANDEALQIARRMREMHEDLREEAQPHVGVPGFGMASRTTVDTVQRGLIRAAAKDVLTGISPNTIAAQWRANGVKTPRGKEWTGHQVARMLRSPRLAGYRVHKGDRYRLDETGEYARCGPELLDEATWEAVCVELDRQAGTRTPQREARSYLLSGIASCGVCTAFLVGNVWPGDGSRYSYKCNAGCLSIAGHRLDAYVERLLLDRWAEAGVETLADEPSVDTEERKRLENLNRKMMAKVNAGTLDLDDVTGAVAENRATIDTLKAAERAAARRKARRRLEVGPAEEWAKHKAADDLQRLRGMVAEEFEHLVIEPRGARGRSFDEGRVRPGWLG